MELPAFCMCVLCYAAMWPRFQCREHGGEGWEATVEKVRSRVRESRDGQAEAFRIGRLCCSQDSEHRVAADVASAGQPVPVALIVPSRRFDRKFYKYHRLKVPMATAVCSMVAREIQLYTSHARDHLHAGDMSEVRTIKI